MRRQTDGEITRLLELWRQGDDEAEERLVPLLYGELKQVARRHLAREARQHTLQPTALVHEAWLRLLEQRRVAFDDRSHFFAIAARMIRRVLIDHARRYRYQKRGAGQRALPLSRVPEIGLERDADLEALDDALTALERHDPEKAKIVEYRFFGGLTGEEIAALLDCSPATVHRHWLMARAWLYRELAAAPDPEAAPERESTTDPG